MRALFWLTAIVAAFLLASIAMNAQWWAYQSLLDPSSFRAAEALGAVACALVGATATRRAESVAGKWFVAVVIIGMVLIIFLALLAALALAALERIMP